ncbi:PREDICTED: DELLA protein RGL1-like [Nicotiana attenuata]|uniref:Della protein rgl2 n=1 Tax=Nicotiana attenuata TaxID=49451 RepID=A0A1J6JB26_NICAT|nr:PREDICTED: DELLA protein RGL1-like [Nicotiana attenuata]OIT08035.1 della protein rgl2 [Nicotiana attenuata]
MANPSFHLASFTSNQIPGSDSSLRGCRDDTAKSYNQLSVMEDSADIQNFCTNSGFYQEYAVNPQVQEMNKQQEEMNVYAVTPQVQTGSHVDNTPFLYLAPFELLRNNPSRCKNTEGDKVRNMNNRTNAYQKLSAMQIMRLAGERFIQFSSNKFININNLLHPYGSALSNLSQEDNQDVELAQILLAAAEKVSDQQYDRARKMLSQCQPHASNTGNPAQRAVFYFAQALEERIDRETGRLMPKPRVERDGSICIASRFDASHLEFHQEVPFTQVVHFTGIQAMLESVATKSKVHLIDFLIRTGVQWASLIQAAAERKDNPIEHMKITVIESVNKERVEETGKSLESFAKSLNFPLSFKIVFLPDRNQLTENHFDIEPDEGLVIYAAFFLRAMICEPNCLETAMRVVRKLQPELMVVSEVEANLNSPMFVNRFIDSLFYYSAFFDCLEDVMKRDDQHRMTLESVTYGSGIWNIVGSEGKERVCRSVNLDVWRTFFKRFGMEEVKLSETCLYQANLIIQQFARRNSCSADVNGGSLTVSWKGTPIYSTSAWKFH